MTAGSPPRCRAACFAVLLAALLFAGAAYSDTPAATIMATPAATGTATPAADTPPAAAPLNAPAGLLANDLGRNLLRYIVECALPAEAVLTTTVEGKPVQFGGALGLAPAWRDKPLAPDDQRWVSACVLARVNYFGVKVPINLQGDHPLPALRTLDAASRAYAIDEGAFYGNLFLPQPVAYTCSGEGPFPASGRWRDQRICTRPTMSDSRLTWCSFVYTGKCRDVCAAQDADTMAYQNCKAPDGSVYPQVLTTRLLPD